ATRHVRIGCLVFCANFRNPGLLAKSLTTIDHLSSGRVECGLGAGWHEMEHRAFGLPFESIGVREDRLEEYAQCLRLLFDQRLARRSTPGAATSRAGPDSCSAPPRR